MGKRNRDVPTGRRRPMIQLGSSQKAGVVNRNNIKEEPVQEPIQPPLSSKKEDHMDTELAGFLAEINALDNTSKNSDSLDSDVKTATKDTSLYDPNTFDPATQGHLLPEPWQSCYDESSAYYYYWNTVTNEVQWYPPAVIIPPPPPPPSVEKQLLLETESEENKIDPSAINEAHDEQKINKVSIFKNSEYVSSSDDDSFAGKKEDNTNVSSKKKDRELMNQIKEKIKRKKEEKIKRERKEREAEDEVNKEEKEEKEEIFAEHLDVEDELRDKLINESEHEKIKHGEQETSNNGVNITTNNGDESFVVDIFANEDNTTEPEPGPETTPEVFVEKEEQNDDTIKTMSHSQESFETEKTKDKAHLKDGKGVWRIIDAGYDDDEEESGKEEEEEMIINHTTKDAEKNSDYHFEMDNYIDMLLEDGIDDKEEMKANNIKNKSKKRKIKEIVEPPIPCEPTLPPEVPPPPPPDDQHRPPLPSEDEPLPELPKVSSEKEEANRKEIGLLSIQIFEKLDFLGISTKDLRNMMVYFIELETRMKDWQAGALDSQYLLDRLYELDSQLLKHEGSAAPPGWLCHWSSNFKMYYYHNTMTGESQWEYPVTEATVDKQMNVQSSQLAMNHYSTIDTALASSTHVFSSDPHLNETKRRSAPETSIHDPYRDPYRKKLKETIQEGDATHSENDSGSSSPLPSVMIAAAPVILQRASREASPAIYAPPIPAGIYQEQPPLPTVNTTKSVTNNGKMKVKKKKKLETSGIPSKKLKHVSSLVQKWQTVKQKVEEEENVEEDSEDEDYEVQTERRITEWKKEIQRSGEIEYNPNFTEIKGDWRERLKRKTTT